MKINLLDSNFSHHTLSKLSCDQQYLNDFEWVRDIKDTRDLVVVTDYNLQSCDIFANKIAWLCEPKTIIPHLYKWIEQNNTKFKYVLTHDSTLLDKGQNYRFIPVGGSWIFKDDQKVYDKSKLLSIIASSKQMTDGHRLRHTVINKFKDKMDVYGRNINTINYKLDGLKDYMYQIVIENGKYDFYFTEKIIDCFVTGTIPIYYGCPSITNYFDKSGIIEFNTLNDLTDIINNLSVDDYNSRLESIKNNFNIAQNFLLPEKNIISLL